MNKALATAVLTAVASLDKIAGGLSLSKWNSVPEPGHFPWVIYDRHGTGTIEDREAIAAWIREQAVCGTGWGSSDCVLTIHLSSNKDATARYDLIELAAQARLKLPEGCPFVIEVQTLEAALMERAKNINRLEDEISWMKDVHRLDLRAESERPTQSAPDLNR